MAAISKDTLRTTAMDHHGLVAALCHDLKIAEEEYTAPTSASPDYLSIDLPENSAIFQCSERCR